MVATAFEERVNVLRGYATLVITVSSMWLVLSVPTCLLFLQEDGYALNVAATGPLGLVTSIAFLLYLLVDSIVGICCRQHFRRSMNAVLLHHAVVGIGVACFLIPAPPRGFFLYVWGEALTAVRLLPPTSRYHARHAVFAARRCLWLYLLARDVSFFGRTRARYGAVGASVPCLVALLLLGLDTMWWREHTRSAGRRADGRGKRGTEIATTAHARATVAIADEDLESSSQPASEDEHGQLLGAAWSGTAQGPNGAAQEDTPPLRHAAKNGLSSGLPSTGSALDLEAARNVSYDDLQIHTP